MAKWWPVGSDEMMVRRPGGNRMGGSRGGGRRRSAHPLLSKLKPLRQAAFALGTLNAIGIKLLLKNRAAGRAMLNGYYRLYAALNGAGVAWPTRSVFEAFPGVEDVAITLEHKPGQGIYADVKEMCYLAMMTRVLAPKRVLEIGTFRGRTALNFALNSPADCEVLTLDLPPRDPGMPVYGADRAITRCVAGQVGCEFAHHPAGSKIRQLWGDSTGFDFSPFVGSIDLVFIDGAHHYAAVASDTANALRLLRNSARAAIVWHDFCNFGDYCDVTRAVLDSEIGPDVFQLEDTQLAVYLR